MKKSNKLTCAGCGLYSKECSPNTKTWFCSNCSTGNANVSIYKAGQKPNKPLTGIRIGDTVTCTDGNKYKIVATFYKFKKNHYYLGYLTTDKKQELKPLPDYFMLRKVKRGS